MATPKLLLRTKTSAAIASNDLLSREVVFGENEKSLFYKTTANNLVRFLYSDDTSVADYKSWSSQKINDSIDTAITNIHQIVVGDSSIKVTDTGMNGLISFVSDGFGVASFTKDGLNIGSRGARVNEISTDSNLTTNSDTKIVTEKAIKGYIDNILSGTRMALNGRISLINGQSYISVIFDNEQSNTNYSISTTVVNTTDSIPSIFIGTVANKTVNGFTVDFNGDIDSANYYMDWILSNKTSEVGEQAISINSTLVDILFDIPKLDMNYSVDVNLTNTIDALPSIYDMVITKKSLTGFSVIFSAPVDSSNYILEWLTDNTLDKTGQTSIATDLTSVTINFTKRKKSLKYIISSILVNTVDSTPSIYSYMITNKTLDGFTILFSGPLDSSNYMVDWIFSELATKIIYSDGSVGFVDNVSGIWPTLNEHLATKEYVDSRIISGRQQILNGEFTKTITLPHAMNNLNYSIGTTLVNIVDDFSGTPDVNGWITTPVSYDYMITGKTLGTFTLTFSSQVDSNNYYIEWFVRSDIM